MSDNITGSDFFLYSVCDRKLSNEVLLEKKGSDIDKKPLHPFIQHLLEQGKEFEKETIEKLGEKEDLTIINGKNAQEKYQKTLKAMKEGKKFIYQGVLIDEKDNFVGIPDLLIRSDEHKSKLGEYQYHPADIKSSYSPEDGQISQVVYYVHLLGNIQGSKPSNAYIYNKSRNREDVFKVYSLENANLEEILQGKKTIAKERLGLEKEIKGLEEQKDALKDAFREKEKSPDYYKSRRIIQENIIRLRKDFRKASYREEHLKNQISIVDKGREFEEQYESTVSDISAIKKGENIPTPTITSECNMCEYNHYCYKVAEGIKEISLVSGMGRSKKKILVGKGVKTIDDLIDAEDKESLEAKGMGKKTIQSMITAALGWKEGRLLTYKDNELIADHGGKPLEKPNIYKPKVAVQIDFEADNDSGNMIMLGLNLREGEKQWANTFFAPTPENEKEMMFEFFDYIQGLDNDVKFYHYAAYEHTHFKDIFDKHYDDFINRYGDKYFDLEDKLMDNLVDLLPIAKSCLSAPVHSYSIKVLLPKVFDFHWREDSSEGKIDGAKFEVLYKRFINGKDEKEKERLKRVMFEYNQDDVLGPWRLYDKLVELSA